MNLAIPAPGIRDPADEFEELGGAQDRINQAGIRDQPLLRQLGTEIAAALEPVGADDRQRDAMPYAGLLRSRDQVPVSKKCSTALSSNEGEFDTLTTMSAPASAPCRPSPVTALTPLLGDACSTS
jgi:hypothetical protein